MLLLKAVLAGLVSTAWLYNPSSGTGLVAIDLRTAVFAPKVGPSVPGDESDPLIRIRLVSEVRPGSVASVRLPAGSNQVITIEVKQSALSEQVLAAAFSVRSSLAARRASHPTANIVLNIPEISGPRPLSPSDQAKFARLVTSLQAQPLGTSIEVTGD